MLIMGHKNSDRREYKLVENWGLSYMRHDKIYE